MRCWRNDSEPCLKTRESDEAGAARKSVLAFPGDGDPAIRADQIPSDAAGLYADVHRALLERGYMLAPSAYEIGFISTSHEKATFSVWLRPWTTPCPHGW